MRLTINKIFFSHLLCVCLISFSISCAVQPVALYNQDSSADTIPHIGNFYATQIFTDYINSELWNTEDTACIVVKNVFDESMIGEGGLYLKWNRTSGGCNWIGIGIGWDGWASKNLQNIYNDAAIQFKVRSPKGIQKGLPWAMSFEDYGGGQAWAGVFSNYIAGQQITEDWTTVEIPLSAFDFQQFDADMTSVKQLIIQFESEGEIYFDELQIVPSTGFQSKINEVILTKSTPVIDGNFDQEIYVSDPFEIESSKVWLSINENNISFFAKVDDKTPLQNTQKDKDIWNGDAIEIAFSTNGDVLPTRKSFLLSDQHLGIRASANPQIWNWRNQTLATGNVITKLTDNGYIIEATIPMEQFIAAPFKTGSIYSIEIAIDAGDNKGRQIQYRWNNPYNEGFNNSPQLWGRMLIVSNEASK